MMNIIDRATKFGLTCDVGTRHFHCGHEYVEIGGLKWATMNIGANSVTDSGLYFQWGDTQGYTAEQVGRGEGKKAFTWAGYKWTNDGGLTITKYNATDGKAVLEASDDAVTAAWGGNWRMPTTEEFQALGNAVNAVWTEDYQGIGVNGLLCTDKTDSSKVLFFPATGLAGAGSWYSIGKNGHYWSSSFNSGYVYDTYNLYFCKSHIFFGDYYLHVNWKYTNFRCIGFPVRGVVDK